MADGVSYIEELGSESPEAFASCWEDGDGLFTVDCIVSKTVGAKGISAVVLVAKGVVVGVVAVRRFAAQMVFCGWTVNVTSIVG